MRAFLWIFQSCVLQVLRRFFWGEGYFPRLRPHAKVFILSSTAIALAAQTQIDLSTQGRNVDFRNAPYTRPVKMGTTLPASCTSGDLFLNVSSPLGQNLYACIVTNTWAMQGSTTNSGSGIASGLLAALPTTCSAGTLYFATNQPPGQQIYSCSSANIWTGVVSIGGSGGLAFYNGSLDIVTAVVPRLTAANSFTGSNSFGGKTTVNYLATGVSTNTDLAGQLTLAGGVGSYSFSGQYTSAPICTASDTTAANPVRVTVTAATLTLSGSGTDVINYICVSRN